MKHFGLIALGCIGLFVFAGCSSGDGGEPPKVEGKVDVKDAPKDWTPPGDMKKGDVSKDEGG